jgi:6-pyruvoyltetrahydropterin/6-carboxytetrahydropterin synthase
MRYYSTKTYGPNSGFSCAFRQWKADSHCHFLHGYPLAFRFLFGSNELDIRNWVVDFGSLKSLKEILERNFDHKTIVSLDDPQIEWYREGHRLGTIDLVVMEAAGCEKFAEFVFDVAQTWLRDAGYWPRVELIEVEVREHEANSAIYRG